MNKPITTATLLLIAFIVGLSSSLFLLPFWIGPFIVAVKNGNPADWIGFAGNFGAGIMTLIAAVVAWFAVQQQVGFQREQAKHEEERRQAERDALRAEAKATAKIAMTPPMHASSAVLYAVRNYFRTTDSNEISRWKRATIRAVTHLGETLNYFSLKEIAGSLSVNDRLSYLSALSHLSNVVTIHRKEPAFELLRDELERFIGVLRAFDDNLADEFEEHSAVRDEVEPKND